MRAMLFALRLVQFYGPDNQLIEIAPDQVASLREPRGVEVRHFHEHAHCLIFTTDGKFTAVREDCRTVEQRLQLP